MSRPFVPVSLPLASLSLCLSKTQETRDKEARGKETGTKGRDTRNKETKRRGTKGRGPFYDDEGLFYIGLFPGDILTWV